MQTEVAVPASPAIPAAPAPDASTTTVDEAQADKDFEAGFTSTPAQADAESRPATESSSTSASTPEKPAETTTTTPAVEEKVVFAGMTEAQLKTTLDKANRFDDLDRRVAELKQQAFGRMGTLQERLDALAKPAAPGQPQKVTKEMLKRLSEEYPELTELLAEDLSGLSLSGAQTPVDVAAIKAEVAKGYQDEIAKLRLETEERFLTIAHPDWKAVKEGADFKEWLGVLTPEAHKQVISSVSAQGASEALTEFKAWLANGKKAAAAAAKPKDERLAHAVTPQGGGADGATALSDDEAFAAGFKSVAGAG